MSNAKQPTILDKIVAHKRKEVSAQQAEVPLEEVRRRAREATRPLDFGGALQRPGRVAIIAEVKKASPSAGVIRPDFDPVAIARAYEAAGASAISILTDEHFFQGRLDYLTQIRQTVALPLLRKDFIIDPYQIYEARAAGADAILLIVAILEQDELERFLAIAADLGLASLVEVHTKQELDRSLAAEAQIIGINNRNLQTFVTDLAVTRDLSRGIPGGKTIVADSGIKTAEDVKMLADCGVSAVLVGETLMRSDDIGAKLQELAGGNREI